MLTLIIHFACVRSLNYCKILITPQPLQHILMEEIYACCFVPKMILTAVKVETWKRNWTSVRDILLKSAKIIYYCGVNVCMLGIDHGGSVFCFACVLFYLDPTGPL